MNIRDLPVGHYAAARLPDGRTAYIPHGDPAFPAARRRLAGKGTAADEARITAWLDAQEPAPVASLWRGEWLQPTLWEAA